MLGSPMRNLTLVLLIVVFSLSLVGAVESQVYPSGKLIGIWEMKVSARENPTNEKVYRKVIAFQKVGDSIKAIDLEASAHVYEVTRQGSKIEFPLEINTDSKAIFRGALKGRKLAGTTEIDGQPAKWEAAMLASVWVCSNHKPVHTATSEGEMRSLASKNKCEGWHRMKSGEDFWPK